MYFPDLRWRLTPGLDTVYMRTERVHQSVFVVKPLICIHHEFEARSEARGDREIYQKHRRQTMQQAKFEAKIV